MPRPICPVGLNEQRQNFWKYNFIQHLAEKHLTDGGLLPPCPPELIVSAHITKVEEHWMGVDSEKTKAYREPNEPLQVGVQNSKTVTLLRTPYSSHPPFPVSSSYTNPATELELTFVGPLADRRTYSARAS